MTVPAPKLRRYCAPSALPKLEFLQPFISSQILALSAICLGHNTPEIADLIDKYSN